MKKTFVIISLCLVWTPTLLHGKTYQVYQPPYTESIYKCMDLCIVPDKCLTFEEQVRYNIDIECRQCINGMCKENNETYSSCLRDGRRRCMNCPKETEEERVRMDNCEQCAENCILYGTPDGTPIDTTTPFITTTPETTINPSSTSTTPITTTQSTTTTTTPITTTPFTTTTTPFTTTTTPSTTTTTIPITTTPSKNTTTTTPDRTTTPYTTRTTTERTTTLPYVHKEANVCLDQCLRYVYGFFTRKCKKCIKRSCRGDMTYKCICNALSNCNRCNSKFRTFACSDCPKSCRRDPYLYRVYR